MGKKHDELKTPIMPECTNWYYSGVNDKALSGNSFQLTVNSTWSRYCYATRTLVKKYSDLVGKTVVVDYEIDRIDAWPSNRVSLAVVNNDQYSGGISGAYDRADKSNNSSNPYHFHGEFLIGTDYTTTYTNYYLTVCLFGNSSSGTGVVKVSNFQCYVKGE